MLQSRDRCYRPRSVGAKPELSRSIRLGGEQTNHEITGAPLGTVLPSKNGLVFRLGLIVSMFNKIQLFPKFKKFSGETEIGQSSPPKLGYSHIGIGLLRILQ